MLGAILCEKYGWTWEEFQGQPAFFVECVTQKLQAEASVSRRNDRRGKMMGLMRGNGVN